MTMEVKSLKNYKNIGFHRHTGPKSLENHEATKLAFADGLMIASITPGFFLYIL